MSETTDAPGTDDTAATEALDSRLDALLAPLDGLVDLPVGEHPAAYEAVHGRLKAVLAGEPHPA